MNPSSVTGSKLRASFSRQAWSISLPSALSGVIVGLMFLLVSLLLWQEWRTASIALTTEAHYNVQDMAALMNETTLRAISGPEAMLDLLAQDAITEAKTLDARMRRMKLLASMLQRYHLVSAIYVGYANGDFFILRALTNQNSRNAFRAPERTAYLMQSIQRGLPGKPVVDWIFLDEQLHEIINTHNPGYNYDPRVRPWFGDAIKSDRQHITSPYVFYSSQQVGITLSQKNAVGDAVAGMDIVLDDLGAELKTMRRTPRSELAIVDGRGLVVSYPDAGKTIKRNGDQVTQNSLAELNVPALLALNTQPRRDGEAVSYVVSGETWIGVRKELGVFADSKVDMLLAIPANDLLTSVKRRMLQQTMWVVVILLILFPIGWYAGRQIGLSLGNLANHAQQFNRFNFAEFTRSKSILREVNELDAVYGNLCLTMQNFLMASDLINREPELGKMLENVLQNVVATTKCEGGAIYLLDPATRKYSLSAVSGESVQGVASILTQDLATEIDRQLQTNRFTIDGAYKTRLVGRDGQSLGLLSLSYATADQYEQTNFIAFADKLSNALAISIDTRNLHLEQQRLLHLQVEQRTRDLEQAMRQVVESERMASLGSIVAGVAHELSTPIGVAVGVATTLQGQARNLANEVANGNIRRSEFAQFLDDELQYNDIMVRNLERASELIQSLKFVSVDQVSNKRREFDLEKVITENILIVNQLFKKSRFILLTELVSDVTLDSYPGPLGQVITNFVSNAITHAFDGRSQGTMILSTRVLDDDHVELNFSDDGVGIAEQDLKHVFEPFFTTKHGKGGSGLGLSIVYNLVTRVLGGKISVDSSLDKGTKFTVILPILAPEIDLAEFNISVT